MKKELITASVFGFIGSFEKSNINILLKQGYEVHVATNMSKDLKAFGDIGQLDGIKVIKHQVSFSRSPLSFQIFKSYKAIKKLIMQENFDIIHCHTPVAAMLTRLAARKARKKGTKVIYTAHGFHFFKGSPLISWFLYYPVEWVCAWITDVLITINKEDYEIAQKHMNAKKVKYIPGIGLDTQKIKNIIVDKENKRKELGIPEEAIVYFSAGELRERKNHEVAIRALGKLDNKRLYYIICGEGELKTYLKDLSQELGISERVILLGFRMDVLELCKCSDVYIFPSIREGLGIAALEGMASGLPLICSDINGIKDYAKNNKTGFCIAPKDVDGFARAIKILSEDSELRVKMGQYNLEVVKKFDISNTLSIMKKIYRTVI